jgi:ATP-dependent Clp endopeptidase proteolytic subunit ClpP
MANNWFYISNSTGSEVCIYGQIMPDGGDDTVSFKSFKEGFQKVLDIPGDSVTVRINSCGGNIVEGMGIYDMMRMSKKKVITVVEGMAASMAGILALGGEERVIYPNAFFMIHRASGAVAGDADEIRSYADAVDSMEKKLKAILSSRTKMSKKQVDDFMKTGIDNWVDAEQAVKLGLATRIESDKTMDAAPIAAQLKGKTPEDVYQQFYNKNTDDKMNEKLKQALLALFAAAGVTAPAANAADDDFLGIIVQAQGKLSGLNLENSQLKNQVTELKKASDDAKAAEINELVNAAVTDKRITAEAKDGFVALGNISIDTLKTTLNNLKPVSVVTIPKNKEKQPEGREAWTFDDWAQKDSAGLAKMEHTNAEAFKKLVEAKASAARNAYSIN